MSASNGLTYIKLYPDDVLSQQLSYPQSAQVWGARMLLWCIATREQQVGTIPKTPKILADWLRITEKQWLKIAPAVTQSWDETEDGQRWQIRRIVTQAKDRDRVIRGARKAGKASGIQRSFNVRSTDVQRSFVSKTNPPTPTLKRREDRKPLKSKSSAINTVDNSPGKEEPGQPRPIVEANRQDWNTPERMTHIAELTKTVALKYPQHWPAIHNELRRWLRQKPPMPIVEKALNHLVEYDARNPVVYARKIIRVDSQNWWADMQAAAHKAAEPGPDSRDPGGLESTRSIIARLAGKQGGPP